LLIPLRYCHTIQSRDSTIAQQRQGMLANILLSGVVKIRKLQTIALFLFPHKNMLPYAYNLSFSAVDPQLVSALQLPNG
jgi:hypothetical protein